MLGSTSVLLIEACGRCYRLTHSCSGRRSAQIAAQNQSPRLLRLDIVFTKPSAASLHAQATTAVESAFEPGSAGSKMLDASGPRTSGSTSDDRYMYSLFRQLAERQAMSGRTPPVSIANSKAIPTAPHKSSCQPTNARFLCTDNFVRSDQNETILSVADRYSQGISLMSSVATHDE
jgi:hypothetical protein